MKTEEHAPHHPEPPDPMTLWYYRSLVETFRAAGGNRLVDELDRVVSELERQVAENQGANGS